MIKLDVKKFSIIVSGFILSVSAVFAGKTWDFLNNPDNFKLYFGLGDKMVWFNWVIYIGLIVALTFIIKEVALKNTKISSRVKGIIAILVSFMGITGIMWVLIKNGRAPNYLMLFMAEIFILVLAGLIVKAGFGKDDGKFTKPFAFRLFVIFLAFILVNGFHGLLLSSSVGLKGFAKASGEASTPLLLGIAQTFNIQLPIGLYIIIYVLVLYFFAGESVEKLDPEEKERKKKVKEYKRLLGLLGKEMKSAEGHFSDLSHRLNSHFGRRRN